MALLIRTIFLLLLISEISSLRFEPHAGGMIFLSKQDELKEKQIWEKVTRLGN